jgi:hypothetical protein
MKCLLALTLFYFFPFSYTQTSWFNEDIINCIVLLEKLDDSQLIPHGTGFLVYNYDTPSNYYIVTCEHVLRNRSIFVKIPADSSFITMLEKSKKQAVDFGNSIWILDGKNLVQEIELKRDTNFVVNTDLDIGIFSIKIIGSYRDVNDSSKHYYTNVKGIPKSMISEKSEVKLGDEVYFLGFPFLIGTEKGYLSKGEFSDEISNPLLRTGTVAYLSNRSSEFLIDALSYGGNSGSPVFLKQGLSNPVSKLIGMVHGHLPSVGSDNMGLARVVWVDDIMKLIELYKKLLK